MRHEVFTRNEEQHTVTLSAADVLAMLKTAGHIPADLTCIEMREDEGSLIIEWRTVSTAQTERP